MVTNPTSGNVRFGEFEADFKTGELFRNQRPVKIQEKPFRLLELLLQSAGTLVSRRRVAEVVWPGVHVEVAGSLNAAVRKLRVALGDNASAPSLIETVGSRGYRFLLPVTVSRRPARTRPVTLMVLPFRNLNEEDNGCGEGLTEQMMVHLGGVRKDLTVMTPLTAVPGKVHIHLRWPARHGSDYLLTGSVQGKDARLRVTAKLILAEDQSCVWARSYIRNNDEDVFAVQAEITGHIAQEIQRVLPLPGNRKTDPGLAPGNGSAREVLEFPVRNRLDVTGLR